MSRASVARWVILLAGFAPLAGGAADAQEQTSTAPTRPRDAAEAVQEGSVTQWLQHYQRERGAEWARSRQETPNPPPEPPAPARTADPATPAK